jgi:hypothetical protein
MLFTASHNGELATMYLRKGIRKPRFRKTNNWKIKNRVLMALLYAKNLKISEFANEVGVTARSASAWIYLGVIPKAIRMKKIEGTLGFPTEFIFDPIHIGTAAEQREGTSKFNENVWGETLVYPLLAGLCKVHDISPVEVARSCKMADATLRKYIHQQSDVPKVYQDSLSSFFKIPPHILFYLQK